MYKHFCVSRFLLAVLIVSWGWAAAVAGEAPQRMTTREILTQADEARGNLAGVEWRLHLRARDSKGDQAMTMDVKARGFDVVSITKTPARSKGDRLIMLKDNMWFDKPGLSKPVPISKRQKLMGTAAYGDIATTDYANDYRATLVGEEKIDGMPCWIYDLKAKHSKVTYDGIKYWVEKNRMVGVKAEYFTVSGKKFKSARMAYSDRVKRNGKLKPFISRISIVGELVDKQRTVLTFSDPVLKKIPDHAFDLSLTR